MARKGYFGHKSDFKGSKIPPRGASSTWNMYYYMWDTCTSHFGPKKFDRVGRGGQGRSKYGTFGSLQWEMCTNALFRPSEVRFRTKIPLSSHWFYNVKTQKTHFLKILEWADFDLLESNCRHIFLHKNQKIYHSGFFSLDTYSDPMWPVRVEGVESSHIGDLVTNDFS